MGVYLMGMYLIGGYFVGVYLLGVPLTRSHGHIFRRHVPHKRACYCVHLIGVYLTEHVS